MSKGVAGALGGVPRRGPFLRLTHGPLSLQGIGFLIMGFIGFFVKLIHIPINNILVGN